MQINKVNKRLPRVFIAGLISKRRESMRRLLSVIVVVATTTFVPMIAMAGNQELADQIAKNLKNSGKMSDYQIAVKVQDGVAMVKGRVTSQEQMNTALKLVFKTPGVTRVVNDLSVGESDSASGKASKDAYRPPVQQVASSYTPSPVMPVSATEPSTLPQQNSATYAPRPINSRSPMPVAMTQAVSAQGGGVPGAPRPMYSAAAQGGAAPVRYDQPCMPNYAWPSYASYPNYAAVTYPRQYSPTAWPYIGPFYPYPQVPLGWRKVSLEWKDGWWFLDFKDSPAGCWR
jgi:hypothetical protein